MNKIVQTANFIWLNETPQPNDIAVFKKKFELKKIPESAETVISAETRYFLWINGKQAVYEGGLFRESMPGCGWADVINLAPFLKKGTNSIVIWVYYYGNGGRNNTRLSAAGLLFQCPSLNLFSDESFLCRKHPGFYTPGDPKPSYLYGGDNIGYNAVLDTDPCFESDEGFNPAVKIDSTVFGNLYQRPIPQFRLSEPFELTDLRYEKGSLTAALPHAMMVLPALSVQAKGGEILDVRTDHWETPGGPGGDDNRYHGHRLEFVCKPGINHFSSLIPLYGEKIVIQVPSAVQVLTVGYQETGYDCDITGSFHCSEPLLDRLVEKSARTLYVCMRDNFMDCPDRERGQWIGDISVQMSQVAFLLDERAMLLAKKAIHDFVSLRKGDILWGNVPGENSCELPSQSLAAISEWGLAAQYWKYTGDRETLSMLFEPAVRYLKLWELDERGLVICRRGNWQWYDHLYNCDGPVIENAWYLSALKFMRKSADILDHHSEDEFLESRISSITDGFEKNFWRKNRYASGDQLVDDRANALAVLSGACPPERYRAIRHILVSVFNSTVYMENFVLTALCEMGCIEDAKNRMMARYYNLATNDNSTLWEDFYRLGTKNHAWSGAPATLAFRYFMGVDIDAASGKFEVHPCWNLFDRMECRFRKDGKNIFIQADSKTKKLTITE